MRCLGDTLNCSSQSQMAILIVWITRTSNLSKCKSSSDGLELEATCFFLWCQLFFNTRELLEHLILKGSQVSIFLHTFSIDILSIILANKEQVSECFKWKSDFYFFLVMIYPHITGGMLQSVSGLQSGQKSKSLSRFGIMNNLSTHLHIPTECQLGVISTLLTLDTEFQRRVWLCKPRANNLCNSASEQ